MAELKAIDHAALSKKLRHRAEECRALALRCQRGVLFALAETYDAMAEQADQLARDIVKSGIKR